MVPPPPSTTNPLMDSINTDAYSVFFANTDSNSIDPSKLLLNNSDPILFSQMTDTTSDLLDSNWSLSGSSPSPSPSSSKRSYNSKKRKFTPANLFSALNNGPNPVSNGMNPSIHGMGGGLTLLHQQQSNSFFPSQLLFVDPNTGQVTSPTMANSSMSWSPTANVSTNGNTINANGNGNIANAATGGYGGNNGMGASSTSMTGTNMIPMTLSPPSTNSLNVMAGAGGGHFPNGSWPFLGRMRQMSPLMTNQYGDVLNMIPSNAHMTTNPSFAIPKVPVSRPISAYSSSLNHSSNGTSSNDGSGNGSKQFLLPFYLRDKNGASTAGGNCLPFSSPPSGSSIGIGNSTINAPNATNDGALISSGGNNGNINANNALFKNGNAELVNMPPEVLSSLLAAKSPPSKSSSIISNDSGIIGSSPNNIIDGNDGLNSNPLVNLTDEVTDAATNFLKEYQKLNFNDVTVIEMKTILRRYGMDATGKKISLIERIRGIAKAIEQKALENLQQQLQVKSQLQEQIHDSNNNSIQENERTKEIKEREARNLEELISSPLSNSHLKTDHGEENGNDSIITTTSTSSIVVVEKEAIDDIGIKKNEFKEENKLDLDDEFAEFIELN